MFSPTPDVNDKRVILVTGANKGIGYEAVKQLAHRLPSAHILLGTRTLDNGSTAIQRMRSEDAKTTFNNVQPLVIDVADGASVKQAVEHVKSTYGRLDVLINNSGIAVYKGDYRSPMILDVNVDGAHDVIESFAPIIPLASGLIIVTSSTVGTYATATFPAELQKLVTDRCASLTWPELRALREDWELYLAEKPSRHQWTPRDQLHGYATYQTSKALVTTYARMRAAQQPTPKLVLVCPGFCKTELNDHKGTDTPAKGAESVTWPLFHPDKAEHGHLYQHGKKLPFVEEAPKGYVENMRMMTGQ